MKKTILFLSAFFLFHSLTYAQAAKSVYVELGGPGLASFNYDMRFTNREDGIGGRIGIGGFKIDNVTAVFIPASVTYLIGKNNRDYFELGAGATYVNVNDSYGNSNDDPFRRTFGHLIFGYRLQPAKEGFLFRASIVPIFGKGFFVPYYAGVAFGYKF